MTTPPCRRCLLRPGVQTQCPAVGAKAGVAYAATPAAAIVASPLTIMCVLDYAAADSILDGPGVSVALVGRTLVQLTNGSEDEVRRQLERVQGFGGHMLCGGIVGYPRHIGRSDTAILYAGSPNRASERGLRPGSAACRRAPPGCPCVRQRRPRRSEGELSGTSTPNDPRAIESASGVVLGFGRGADCIARQWPRLAGEGSSERAALSLASAIQEGKNFVEPRVESRRSRLDAGPDVTGCHDVKCSLGFALRTLFRLAQEGTLHRAPQACPQHEGTSCIHWRRASPGWSADTCMQGAAAVSRRRPPATCAAALLRPRGSWPRQGAGLPGTVLR